MIQEQVAVVGLGLLGRGIVSCLLGHGYRVFGFAKSADERDHAESHIRRSIDEMIEHGGFDRRLREEWPARYARVNSPLQLADCTLVIESVTENIEVKNQVFDEIEGTVAADVPIASNTSAIPISELQKGRRTPERFLGMHWAAPAYATRFLEIIRGEQTNDLTFGRALALARRCGKEPSVVNGDVPGFIVNRLGYAMYREALHLIETGVADAETIDRSFSNAVGLWATLCGPLRWIDLTGGPAAYAQAMKPVLPTLSNERSMPTAIARLAKQDARGVINGHGFYDYAPGDVEHWDKLFRDHAWDMHHTMNRCRPLEEET